VKAGERPEDGGHRGRGFDPECSVCKAFRLHLNVAAILAEDERGSSFRGFLRDQMRRWRWRA